MRTTLNLNESLYRQASKAVGISEKTKLIHLGLESLIRQEARKRLAGMFGAFRRARAPRRRRVKI